MYLLGRSALTRDTEGVKKSRGKRGFPFGTEITYFILKCQHQKDEWERFIDPCYFCSFYKHNSPITCRTHTQTFSLTHTYMHTSPALSKRFGMLEKVLGNISRMQGKPLSLQFSRLLSTRLSAIMYQCQTVFKKTLDTFKLRGGRWGEHSHS